MENSKSDIEDEPTNINALIFILLGVLLWVLLFITAIYIMAIYWSKIDKIWKFASAFFMVLLSPLISIIFVLLGVISSLQKAN